MKNILITGGTGLVGQRLTQLLLAKGYAVRYLSRSAGTSIDGIQKYKWDLRTQSIDQEAIAWAEGIINLAGANVGEGRWTKKRKKELYDSRIDSVNLLHSCLQEDPNHKHKVFISASAIGIYGFGTSQQKFTEQSQPADDFLATLTNDWEAAMDKVASLGIRTAKLRVGVVLSNDGGALPKIAKPIKLYAGAALGSGKQILSWIHIDDLCRLFIAALENESYQGAFNAVAPKPVSNKEFTASVASILKKPLFLPPVPSFMLKLLLGEMASIATQGAYIDCQKVIAQGFEYIYSDHKQAIKNLL